MVIYQFEILLQSKQCKFGQHLSLDVPFTICMFSILSVGQNTDLLASSIELLENSVVFLVYFQEFQEVFKNSNCM